METIKEQDELKKLISQFETVADIKSLKKLIDYAHTINIPYSQFAQHASRALSRILIYEI